jgi:hypothetical protein
MFDASTMSKSFFSLGLWKPEWESQPDPSFREIGYFEAELFEPAKWKPSFPNIAFEQMEGGDAYWGTRIVTAFPKDLIERIVQDGEFQNRAAAQYVVDVLLKRQKKIGEYWLNRITPVEEPTLSGARLQFRDLAVDRGYATQGSREYRFQVKSLSGRGLTTRQSLHSTDLLIPDLQSLAAQVPEQSADSFGRVPLLKVVIESNLPGNKWALPTEVYIGRETGSPALKVLGWAHAPEKN